MEETMKNLVLGPAITINKSRSREPERLQRAMKTQMEVKRHYSKSWALKVLYTVRWACKSSNEHITGYLLRACELNISTFL
jgi:hypothetical protein